MAQWLEHFQQPALGVLPSLVEFLHVGSVGTQCFAAFGSATEKIENTHHQMSGERVSHVFGRVMKTYAKYQRDWAREHKHIEKT